jgi:hypothetical protein
MPLRQKKQAENEESQSPKLDNGSGAEQPCKEPHCGDDDEEEEDDVFDDELLSQISFSGDKPTSSCSTAAVGKSRADAHQSVGGIDGKPESMVLIDANDTQFFFGYFSLSRWGWNVSGPFAGVPPSIYAPVAFVGATLTSLKVNHCEASSVTAFHYQGAWITDTKIEESSCFYGQIFVSIDRSKSSAAQNLPQDKELPERLDY